MADDLVSLVKKRIEELQNDIAKYRDMEVEFINNGDRVRALKLKRILNNLTDTLDSNEKLLAKLEAKFHVHH